MNIQTNINYIDCLGLFTLEGHSNTSFTPKKKKFIKLTAPA